jgi:hypothetical protein
MATGPLQLVDRMARLFDDLGIEYALGGSMASALLGEPRSTVDVDMAVRLDGPTGEALLARVAGVFYAPMDSARAAIRTHSSFNLVDTANALKVDLFVVGEGLLDRMQLERRVHVDLPGLTGGVWVTSAEDQVLRKLDWYRLGGSVSDRQWRDVVGILRVRKGSLDEGYLDEMALAVDLVDALSEARHQAETSDEAEGTRSAES